MPSKHSSHRLSHRKLPIGWLGLAALVSFTAGCGSTDFPVRPAKGQVLCDGKPVASGSITFTPMAMLANGKLANLLRVKSEAMDDSL